MWIHNYQTDIFTFLFIYFYKSPYECRCFEFTVGDELWECKSKFTIGNSFESINNALKQRYETIQRVIYG